MPPTIYKAYWHAANADLKQQSNDASTLCFSINAAIYRLSEHVFDCLEARGYQAKIAYAYSPREGGNNGFFSPGKDHYQLLVPVEVGRLKRAAGDALCKPAEKFWGLQGSNDKHTVTCQSCLSRMLTLLK